MDCSLDVQPFTYSFIPCDDSLPVTARKFEGKSDDELRSSLAKHFRQNGLSQGQSSTYRKHLTDSLKEKSPGVEVSDELLAAVDSGTNSFEIVPVIYPTPKTDFKGTSLYIDQIGMFKDLPLNNRASTIAQRAIRGDAFCLRCEDNEVKDVWRRIDCTPEATETLIANPPPKANDPETQTKMKQLATGQTMQGLGGNQVEPEPTHDITTKEISEAEALKGEGNDCVKTGHFEGAYKKYSHAKRLLSGKTEGLSEEEKASVDTLVSACLSNRSLCNLKTENWPELIQDCDRALSMECTPKANHVKLHFRRANGYMGTKEFDRAREDCEKALEQEPDNQGVKKLQAMITKMEAVAKAREQKQYSKMFKS